MRRQDGQATVLLVGIVAAALVGALVLGAVAGGLGRHGGRQGAVDLAALAAARYMRDAYPYVLEPVHVAGVANDDYLDLARFEAEAGRVAGETARRNGIRSVAVSFPGARTALVPSVVRVTAKDDLVVAGRHVEDRVSADAELTVGGIAGGDASHGAGEYAGPYAYRSGHPMRPDVALAYDRMARAARSAGIDLFVVSGYRSDAEQAALFAAHPDPKWVAPPGKSLHRLGTELDLGPGSAYRWLIANAGRFGFVQRYSWEPWHFGFSSNAGSASLGYTADRRTSMPSFVPAAFAPSIARAAQRWNVGAALLSAQLYQESGFNPFARSGAGAEGIAQFMPATAARYGLRDAYDASSSIDAQAHLMRDLLRRFGSVPLALAAYNAGPTAVAACGCVPAIPETQAYVTEILALLRGAGDPAGADAAVLQVRLVR
jgi:hypothetical protein